MRWLHTSLSCRAVSGFIVLSTLGVQASTGYKKRCEALLNYALVEYFRVILELFGRDPMLAYSLTAALFLAVVALISGWLRGDVLLLFQPLPLLQVCAAVALAALLLVGQRWLLMALPALPDWLPTVSEVGWPLAGTYRLPLYALSLALGSSAGLLAALLFAAFHSEAVLAWAQAILALELLLVGWLAIAPSPYRQRWATALNIVLAYTLTQLTAGVAWLHWQGSLDYATGLGWLERSAGGMLLSALLLTFLAPHSYSRLFPQAAWRFAPDVAAQQKMLTAHTVAGKARPRRHEKLRFPQRFDD